MKPLPQYPKVIFLTIVLMTSALARDAGSTTVVDLYRLLPAKHIKAHRYALTSMEGSWKTQSIAEYEIEPLVDIPNGYLKIIDHGTGGGTEIVEAAVFTTLEGRRILGLAQSSFDGVSTAVWIGFYLHDRGSWKDVTVQVMPRVTAADFLDPGYPTGRIPHEDISVTFTLPRHGTTVIARIDTSRISMKLAGNNLEASEAKRLGEFMKAVRYREVDLEWSVKSGRFSPGKRR